MGKKRQKKGEQESPNVAEATRIRVSQILDEFRAANDVVYTFEENLTNHERAVVHELCRKLGMRSRSSGNGIQRRVSVYKTTGKSDNLKGEENLRHVSFSQDAQGVLQELFTYYPPGDGEPEEKSLDRPGGKTGKSRANKDDIFRKPVMNKEDIAKKVEALASRMKKAANLCQVAEQRLKLPIASYREAITSTVEANQVVLISGETGCGKTTQVPQYLLDHMWSKSESCKIICTQPRRISATSVSERISYERGENIGEDIGYKIRLESKGGRHSSVMFCTNGVLLRVLVSRGTDGYVPDITHIIVDEIHERDCYSDFMLTIIRDMLPSNPHLRLILMSATLDAERFSQYFGGCPVIRVPGFTYPVKTFYLEDVLSILKSAENNHLESTQLSIPIESELMEEDKAALDEAINLAWTDDEFDTLIDLVSFEGTINVHNYQHSLTGLTPLMVFAAKGRVSDVCMLLSVGADCHLRSKDGMTALQLAERKNQPEVAQIIREHTQSSSLSNSAEQQQFLDKYMATINPEVIDVSLMVQLMRKICADSDDGAILVFLSGWDDINKIRERLLANPFFRDNNKFIITSLHSMVPAAEQKKAFKRTPPGCRKIVLATNIAESAITIDDVVYVIDSGRMKEKSYDPYNNVSTLQSSWVSKANAKQREGRAGRCQPGICYHLYSKLRAASLPDFQVPEIKRMPIEELCLQVKLLDPNCKIQHFLQKTLDPPVHESIHNAIIILQDIGALSNDEGLTELGEKLGQLPVHPLTSKMLFFAILVNCLDPALTLACASDYKDPFTLPMLPNEKKKAAAAKYELASLYGGQSDHLAVIAALECWRSAKQRGQEARFCSEYFVSSSTMHMLDGMRKQLQSELVRHRFILDDVSNLSLNARDPGILRAVLVAGLYPMVGRLIPFQNKKPLVETAGGAKVRLIARSLNFKLSIKKKDDYPLLVYDEITRGDGGMHIKSCTVVGALPLLLFATEIAVAPVKHSDNDEVNDDEDEVSDDEGDCEEEDMQVDKSVGRGRQEIMSSPDNEVKIVVDRWLSFRSRALDVAQVYCLRERLSSSILFKVKHPCEVLPPVLGASMHAIASVLTYDGLSGISSQSETMESLTSMVHAAEIDESGGSRGGRRGAGSNNNRPNGFLRSLFYRHNFRQNSPSPHHSHGNQQLVGTRQLRPRPGPTTRSDIGSDFGGKDNHPQMGPKADSFKRQRGYKPR